MGFFSYAHKGCVGLLLLNLDEMLRFTLIKRMSHLRTSLKLPKHENKAFCPAKSKL